MLTAAQFEKNRALLADPTKNFTPEARAKAQAAVDEFRTQFLNRGAYSDQGGSLGDIYGKRYQDVKAQLEGRNEVDEPQPEGWRGEWARPLALLKPGTTKAMVEFYKVAVAETEAGFEMLAGELAQ